jgi:hypothetical protein
MAKGGTRRGAGRKVGSKSQTTLAKAAVEAEYRRYMLEEKRALWRSQRERAIGVYVLIVKTKEGITRVTDPAAMEKILAKPAGRGKTHWLIEAQPADATFAKEINNRVMGVPTQLHEVEVSGAVTLGEKIAAARARGAALRAERATTGKKAAT